MVSAETARKLALALEGTEILPHFEKESFRVRKKIYATLDVKLCRSVLKLSEMEQSLFAAHDPTCIYPVPNKWGKQGWTMVELKKVRREVYADALRTAYCQVAPPALASKYRES
jgi:hypothetical protein